MKTNTAIVTLNEFDQRVENLKNEFSKYNVDVFKPKDGLTFLVIEDALVLCARIYKGQDNLGKYHDNMMEIRELSANNLNIKYETKGIVKFKGLNNQRYEELIDGRLISINNAFDKLYPQLKIKERYEAWQGMNYNIILMEMDSKNGRTEYDCVNTKMKPIEYIKDLEKRCIKGHSGWINRAFITWKGERRNNRFEKHFRYYFEERYFKESNECNDYVTEIRERAKNGEFDDKEKYSYIHPDNRWKSEETVYKLVKKMYKNYAVIYQHRPNYLKSNKGGQLSYDVYIAKLKIAIEYQGEQHFNPVEYFGGEQSLKETQLRDKLKEQLATNNGDTIIYINYNEPINEATIKTRIDEAIKNKHKIKNKIKRIKTKKKRKRNEI